MSGFPWCELCPLYCTYIPSGYTFLLKQTKTRDKILNEGLQQIRLFFFVVFYWMLYFHCVWADKKYTWNCFLSFLCREQPETLVGKQTAIHGGHMCKAPSASTTSPSFSKTATSAFSFYSPQHMSLRWWQSWLRLSCCSCPLVQTYIFRYLSAFIIPSSVAADKRS